MSGNSRKIHVKFDRLKINYPLQRGAGKGLLSLAFTKSIVPQQNLFC